MVVDGETLLQTGLQDKTGQPSYGMCRIKYINKKKIIKHQLNGKTAKHQLISPVLIKFL